MTITRAGLHAEILHIDEQIAALQKDKAGAFEAYREQLASDGQIKSAIKLEIDAFKKAHRRVVAWKKNANAEMERDDLTDEIFTEIMRGTKNATRTRDARETSSLAKPSSVSASGAAIEPSWEGKVAAPTNSDNSRPVVVADRANCEGLASPSLLSSDDQYNTIPSFLARV